MKAKNVVVYNIILLVVIALTAEIVTYQLTGHHLFQSKTEGAVRMDAKQCTNTKLPARSTTNDPQLKTLAEYEAACQSVFLDELMLFTTMPNSTESALQMADTMTARLREFDTFGVRPIVIMEPDSEWGLIDFHEYATGFYDQWIREYFERLKANGIKDEQLGIWVPFPEPQQPTWNNNSNPDDFAQSINRHFTTLRSVFPKATTAILLDSQTGEEGRASQVLAYTRLINEGLVDYAGLQGFPWHPTVEGDERQSVTSASIFAPASLLEGVAKTLGTKKVFINTGTYRHKKADSGGFAAVTTAERQATLDSIYDEVAKLQKDKYEVLVNVFAENKLDVKEGVDWSYWQPGQYAQSGHTSLFTDFVHKLKASGARVGIYDARK